MAKDKSKSFGAFIPQFHSDVEVVNLNGKVNYLHDKRNNNYLKIVENEYEVVEDIFKKISLIEIVEKRMLKNAQLGFNDVLRLVLKIMKAGFLKEDENFSQNRSIQSNSIKAGLANQGFLIQGINMFRGFNILEINTKTFTNVISKKLPFISNSVFVLILGVLSTTGLAGAGKFLGDFRLFYDLPGFSPVMSYYFSVFSVWLFINILLTLKNLVTAAQFASSGIELKTSGLKFSYGFLFYSIDIKSVIKAKFKNLIAVFLTRIITPLFVSGISFLAYSFYFQSQLIMLFSYVAFFLFLFSISPLFKSDFSTLLYFTTKSGGNFNILNLVNNKRIFQNVFNWKRSFINKQHFVFYTLFTIAWTATVFVYLATFFKSEVPYIWQEILVTDSFLDKISMGLVLFTISTPLILAFSIAIAITVINTKSYISKPFSTVMDKLSIQLRDKDMPSIDDFKLFMSHIPVLSHLSAIESEMLYSKIRVKRYSQDSNIVIQGEKGDYFYLIYYGKAEVFIESSIGDFVRTDILKAGDVFGEIALSVNVPRTATVRTVTPTMAFVLDKETFSEYIVKKMGDGSNVTELIRVSRMLLNNNIFSYLPSKQILDLYKTMEKRIFKKGETIFSQDQEGDCMYVIYEGDVEIERREDEKTVLKKILKKGTIFGEISVLKKSLRTAAACAASDCCLYMLKRKDFFGLINSNIALAIEIDGLAHERLYECGGVYH